MCKLNDYQSEGTNKQCYQLTNLIQLLILGFVKESMEEEVGGVLALVQWAHPSVAHPDTR